MQKCGKILRGRKDTLAPMVSTLRGRAPPSPPPFRRLWLFVCVSTNKHDDDDDDDDACDVMFCRQQPAAAALVPTSDPRVGAPLEFWQKRRKTDHNHRRQRQHVAGRPIGPSRAQVHCLTD